MKILFMCVANSARSQIAEGLARQILRGVEIKSAGSNPGVLNPLAVQVMKEVGIDISRHYSKSVSDLSPDFVEGLDYIIALCAEEVCPVMMSKAQKLHWPLPDPATLDLIPDDERLKRFRSAREAIRAKLEAFRFRLSESASNGDGEV